MSYLTIIPLATAKNYLRIDEDLSDDDSFITAIIEASLSEVEQKTNHILFARSKSYVFDQCGEKRVYDYPINSVTSPTDVESEVKDTYTLYTAQQSTDTTLVLNVGYASVDDVPQVLIEWALFLIGKYYYGKEGAEGDTDKLPMWIENSVNRLRRFIL